MSRIIILLSLLGAASASLGAAASLALSTASIGASSLTVPRCTSAGIGVIENLSGSNVVSVTISNLPGSCGAATAQVTVSNGSANSSGTGTVPGGGGSLTVALGVSVAATTNHRVDLVLTGP
jgi:hypothetical protein